MQILFLSIKCDGCTYDGEQNICQEENNCNGYRPSIIFKSCYSCNSDIDFFVIKNESCKECQYKNLDEAKKVIYSTSECVKYCPSNTW